jgi:hypothetical protein
MWFVAVNPETRGLSPSKPYSGNTRAVPIKDVRKIMWFVAVNLETCGLSPAKK